MADSPRSPVALIDELSPGFTRAQALYAECHRHRKSRSRISGAEVRADTVHACLYLAVQPGSIQPGCRMGYGLKTSRCPEVPESSTT